LFDKISGGSETAPVLGNVGRGRGLGRVNAAGASPAAIGPARQDPVSSEEVSRRYQEDSEPAGVRKIHL
jgi:hypothetical protein